MEASEQFIRTMARQALHVPGRAPEEMPGHGTGVLGREWADPAPESIPARMGAIRSTDPFGSTVVAQSRVPDDVLGTFSVAPFVGTGSNTSSVLEKALHLKGVLSFNPALGAFKPGHRSAVAVHEVAHANTHPAIRQAGRYLGALDSRYLLMPRRTTKEDRDDVLGGRAKLMRTALREGYADGVMRSAHPEEEGTTTYSDQGWWERKAADLRAPHAGEEALRVYRAAADHVHALGGHVDLPNLIDQIDYEFRDHDGSLADLSDLQTLSNIDVLSKQARLSDRRLLQFHDAVNKMRS